MELNDITGAIIASALKVHSALGPGLLERTYAACVCHDLKKLGLTVEIQKRLPIVYDGVVIDGAYRLDLLVQDEVIVEIKAIETILPVHHAQLLSYLKLSGKRVGLLINFNVPHLVDGIKRMVNRF